MWELQWKAGIAAHEGHCQITAGPNFQKAWVAQTLVHPVRIRLRTGVKVPEDKKKKNPVKLRIK